MMGIANLTDNSFVAGIVDIGACSTAPGNAPVSEEEELARMDTVHCFIHTGYMYV